MEEKKKMYEKQNNQVRDTTALEKKLRELETWGVESDSCCLNWLIY